MQVEVANISDPSDDVKEILRQYFHEKPKEHRVERNAFTSEHLAVLDAHVALSFGQDDCEILYGNGCNSCCADGISGAYLMTTCGPQCNKICGNVPCE